VVQRVVVYKEHHVKEKLFTVALFVGGVGLCVGLSGLAQQGQPSQPPRPANPTPHPATPKGPDGPGTPIHPALPPGPTNPTTPMNPKDPTNPSNTNGPNGPNKAVPGSARSARPFVFQNPTDEARFNEGTQKLVRMEQRFDQSNQTLLKRLGEIRQMSPEKQSASTMDLLQQMLKSQTEMQQYLVSSRSLWTGDVDAAAQATEEAVPAQQLVNPQNNSPR